MHHLRVYFHCPHHFISHELAQVRQIFRSGVIVATVFIHLLVPAIGKLTSPCLRAAWKSDVRTLRTSSNVAVRFFSEPRLGSSRSASSFRGTWELSLAMGGGRDEGLRSKWASALEGACIEGRDTSSGAAIGFPLLFSLGTNPGRLAGVWDDSETPVPALIWESLEGIPWGVGVHLDVFIGTVGGGDEEDMEMPGWCKAGEGTENDLTGGWTEAVRWTWPARNVFAVPSRREST